MASFKFLCLLSIQVFAKQTLPHRIIDPFHIQHIHKLYYITLMLYVIDKHKEAKII